MLNISKQIYAGFDPSKTKYDLPEAEVVPFGESANEKKKLEGLTHKYKSLAEYDNIPLPGFTLYKADRKNFGSLDQTWLVIDPRGFLVRISTDNLEKILHVTGITEGLIQERCVWAREDSQTKMTLVPTSSQSYIDAIKNTELIEGKVSIKDVEIGDTVIMQNGLQGIYRGTLSLYGPSVENYKDAYAKPQVFLRRQIVEIDPQKFYYQSDTKILKIVSRSPEPITKEASAAYLNERIAAGAIFTTSPTHTGRYYSTRGMIKYVSVHAVPKLKIKLVEIDELEATALFHDANADSDNFKLMVANSTTSYIVDFPYSFSSSSPVATIHSFDILKARLDPDCERIDVLEKSQHSFYGRQKPGTHSLDRFTKFYKIVKCVKNETYV